MQWLQGPNQSNVGNLIDVRRVASRHSRKKRRNIYEQNLTNLKNNCKTKNIRDLYSGNNEFKKGYQPITNIINDEKGDFVTDSHSILARWKSHFNRLLNVHEVPDIKQTETHTAGQLVPEPNAFEFEMAIEKLRRHKSPGTDQIPTELNKAEGRINRSEIRKLTNSILSMEE